VRGRQPALEVGVASGQVVVAAQGVAEGDLLRPPQVAGLDHVQVRVPVLPGRVGLDEEPAPPAAVEVGRYVVPARRPQPLAGLVDDGVEVDDQRHQVDDGLGGEAGHGGGADVLDSVRQPRFQ
jgi:hypothetical protein